MSTTTLDKEYPMWVSAALMMTKDQQASPVPTDSGVMLRDPQSGDWIRIDPGIEFVRGLAVDPNDPCVCFLACSDGILRSLEGGNNWRMVTGWREADILRIVIDPANGSRLYAATAWGLLFSENRGDCWDHRSRGMHETYVKSIALDHRDSTRLLSANTSGLYESNNRGIIWNRTSFDDCAVLCLEQSCLDSDTWIIGTEGQGVHVSRDNARTWHPVKGPTADANIYSVAIDPQRPGHLLAGGWGTGVWLSVNENKSWTMISGALSSENITALAFDPQQKGRLWVSTFEEGTFFSDDDGATWQNGGLYGAYVFDLTFVPKRCK